MALRALEYGSVWEWLGWGLLRPGARAVESVVCTVVCIGLITLRPQFGDL